MRVAGSETARAVRKTLSNLSILAGAAALTASVAVAPALAKKSKAPENEQTRPAVDQNQPMTIVISLRNQKANIYRGMTLVTSTRVSTGKRGYSTKPGVYSILEKRRRHYSNLYAGAPMPWMQRLTWSGTALHAGVVPGYPASHGCVRLPYSFAPKLFRMTNVGEQVVIARSMVEPKLFSHPALFQPLPLPMPPMMAKDDQESEMRRSSNDVPPAPKTLASEMSSNTTRLPVVFAKAEAVMPPAGAPATTVAQALAPSKGPAQRPMLLAVLEDTRTHAIDPTAGPSVGSGLHAFPVEPMPSSVETHAAVESSDDFVKHLARLADPAEAVEVPETPKVSVSASAIAQPEAPAPANATVAMTVPAPAEPEAGPILTISASALAKPPAKFASVAIKALGTDDHPPLPPLKPSVIAAKLIAGTTAAAVEAAEPRSIEPLRVLITRRTKQDRLIDVQYLLASMGHLDHQKFDGTFGKKTVHAIKAFQRANELPETGAFTDELEKKIYQVAGKKEPPAGHLFVRQKFASVFDKPVRFRNPTEPLGTHVFTVMHFGKDATEAQWMAISLKPDADPTAVLNRIEIPEDVRQTISERLTPGSSLIVADTAINSATLPTGADFLVWDTSKTAKLKRASVSPRPRKKKRRATSRRRTQPAYVRRARPVIRYQRGPWRPF